MKRALIVAVLALLLGAFLVTLIVKEPGYVLIAYGNYTIESSVWILLLGFGSFFLALYILLRLVRSFLGSASLFGQWYGGLSARQAHKATLQAFIAMLEGNEARAKKLFIKAAPNTEQPLLNYWLAATLGKTLDTGSEGHSADQLVLAKFQELFPDADTLGSLLQAELLLRAQRHAEVLEQVKPYEAQGKKFPVVYRLLYQAQAGLGHWPEAVDLLPQLQQYHLLTAEDFLAAVRRSYWQLFDPDQARHRDTSGKLFRNAWDKRPAIVKDDAQLAARYARCMMALDDDEEVELLLRQWLEKHPLDKSSASQQQRADLIELYGLVEGTDVKRQLKQAEKWLLQTPDDPVLLLTVGRLALRNQLWALARDHFEHSHRRSPRADTCAELARLLSHLGEHEKSERYYREGLLSRIGGLPVLPQPQPKK